MELRPSLVRTVLTRGLGFGVVMTLIFWALDAFNGRVLPWPRWAFEYGLCAVLGGVLYGCLHWWLERRSAR